MPYKDVTYDNGFTERFYFDEALAEEGLRLSRINSTFKFPSMNCRYASKKRTLNQSNPKKFGVSK